MLYESKTWCLKEDEMAILRRNERGKTRAMYGVKLIEKRNCQNFMDLLGLEETLDMLAKADGMR